MLEIIKKYTNKFFNEILDFDIQEAKSFGKEYYGAAIFLTYDKTEVQWYLLFKKSTLNEIAKVLLFEDNLKDSDLDDLLKEVSNLIIGSAKVELQEKFKGLKLSTPEFLGEIKDPKNLKMEEFLLYKFKNRTFIIGKKTVDK